SSIDFPLVSFDLFELNGGKYVFSVNYDCLLFDYSSRVSFLSKLATLYLNPVPRYDAKLNQNLCNNSISPLVYKSLADLSQHSSLWKLQNQIWASSLLDFPEPFQLSTLIQSNPSISKKTANNVIINSETRCFAR